jgi:hypothetical protein
MQNVFMIPAVHRIATSLRRTLVLLSQKSKVKNQKLGTGQFNIHRLTFNIRYLLFFIFHFAFSIPSYTQPTELASNNITWTSQSKHAGESMPCGGGDIGLNVWVENGEILFYMSRSGTFDENNTLLKHGRVRIKLSPNPFDGGSFKQELLLQEGYVRITGSKQNHTAEVKVWVNVFNPVINVEVNSNKPVLTEASYESWRYKDRKISVRESFQTSYKWAPQGDVKTFADSISFTNNSISFFHQNRSFTVFEVAVKQQGLDSIKQQLDNPLANKIFGGVMEGTNMKPAGTYEGKYVDTDFKGWRLKSSKSVKQQSVRISLNTDEDAANINTTADKNASVQAESINWWKQFWDRSFIFIKPASRDTTDSVWQAGRNYQLMRYMLGCNAFGKWPTKFNGGLFTVDPFFTDTGRHFTPDFRNWGGGTHTAQNQRLVYFPMIKSGDFDALKPQLDFYASLLKNATLKTQFYWKHKGAFFPEQLENYGLYNPAEYEWKRPADFDKGVEYNAWLEYEWDTVLEFCLMMLDMERYAKKDITEYIPLIESCLTFFDEHYQYLAKQRGRKALDAEGHIVLYPGSAAETYKMAYNSTSTIAALETITKRILQLPASYLDEEKRKHWQSFLTRIPPISFASFDGHKTIAPAKVWERINNTESPQLYPVYPWVIYGVGKKDLDVAINTYKLDTNVLKFRSHVGWKQDNIFAARLGLTAEAARLTTMKLKNSGRRFPAFWGPGYDWTPDHNWGGSGMIGLQEMLMQVDDEKIFLFPAWPKEWDVHFKLHAPYETTVEGVLKNGKVELLKVVPEGRRKDVVNMLDEAKDGSETKSK